MWLCTKWPRRCISSQGNCSVVGRAAEGWKALRKQWAPGKEGWGKTFSSLNVNQLPKATEAPRGGDRNNYMINGNVLIQVSGIQHSGIQRRQPYCSLTHPLLGTNNYAPPPQHHHTVLWVNKQIVNTRKRNAFYCLVKLLEKSSSSCKTMMERTCALMSYKLFCKTQQ